MKKFIIPALLVAGIVSCTTKQSDNSKRIDSTGLSRVDSALPIQGAEQNIRVRKDSTVPSIVERTSLPSILNWKGDFSQAWTWVDKSGKNILLLSSSKSVVKEEGEDVTTGSLFARHFVLTDGKSSMLWELNDFQKDCVFDMTSEFVGNPIIVDADANGIMESYIAYKLSCRSDVSPANMKIIVHEEKKKYALRGVMLIKMNEEETSPLFDENREPDLSKVKADKEDYIATWGRYENANDFTGAPALLEVARQMWIDNRNE